ncbi:MAG: PIG-L family deacetylase [Syntrophales bacterium]|nr:PIG-L family deacetylase [Syntrophales bacterium]
MIENLKQDRPMNSKIAKSVAVIVAHPDDETLWTGGTILSHPLWQWFIVCLCRGSDIDRAPRFYNALKIFKSEGIMGDLDDGPEQKPLDKKEVELAILDLLPPKCFDLIISHNPTGEYTRHIRHEEVSEAVIKLWHAGKISTNEFWAFAYEDGNKEYYPRPVKSAPLYRTLTKRILRRKYSIITETYGFEKSSFEAETTPKAESFWQFTDPDDAEKWLNNGGVSA